MNLIQNEQDINSNFRTVCRNNFLFFENVDDFSHLTLLKGSCQGGKKIIDVKNGNFLYPGYCLT